MTHIHNEHGSCCGGHDQEDKECCGGHDHNHDQGSCCGGHDHDHEHHHTPVVTFENEDGTTEDHPIVDEFELDGNVYVLVMNQDETVTPLRVEGEEGELVFLDEEEFNKVSEAYAEMVEAEEDEEPLQ
ncbi:DUF1292 domain-containing protein [Proteiniclasticum ruminis]|uniref:DUF1292 domain-containing protein n=1 Tax=Proteiniclasticum ruminis TaxID=398199 RepID=A0A1I4XUW1_9CLOT|nr:DUF1292 domain-containing protein [Proteiniclasticum ruminis]SFN29173.1 Protein of unknown function [Proteiniclasticum ruminis]